LIPKILKNPLFSKLGGCLFCYQIWSYHWMNNSRWCVTNLINFKDLFYYNSNFLLRKCKVAQEKSSVFLVQCTSHFFILLNVWQIRLAFKHKEIPKIRKLGFLHSKNITSLNIDLYLWRFLHYILILYQLGRRFSQRSSQIPSIKAFEKTHILLFVSDFEVLLGINSSLIVTLQIKRCFY